MGDHYFVSTQMQLRHDEAIAQEEQELRITHQVQRLEKFNLNIKSPIKPTLTAKVIQKKRTATKKKPKKQSLSELVRSKFAESRLGYFSGDQTKIDDFVNQVKCDTVDSNSNVYTKEEWASILKHIKLEFPNLNHGTKRSLKLITQRMNEETERQVGSSIWLQALIHPEISNEDLKWLYDLNDEQMDSQDVAERDELGLFVMTLSQDVLAEKVSFSDIEEVLNTTPNEKSVFNVQRSPSPVAQKPRSGISSLMIHDSRSSGNSFHPAQKIESVIEGSLIIGSLSMPADHVSSTESACILDSNDSIHSNGFAESKESNVSTSLNTSDPVIYLRSPNMGDSLEGGIRKKSAPYSPSVVLDSEPELDELEPSEPSQITTPKLGPTLSHQEIPDIASFHSLRFAESQTPDHILEVSELCDLQKDARIRDIVEKSRSSPILSPFFSRTMDLYKKPLEGTPTKQQNDHNRDESVPDSDVVSLYIIPSSELKDEYDSNKIPHSIPGVKESQYTVLPVSVEKEVVVFSDEESIYSTARSRLEDSGSVRSSVKVYKEVNSDEEDEQEESDKEGNSVPPSSMPSMQPSRKRKLHHTTRYQLESNLKFHEYEDKRNKITLRKLGTMPVVLDSDNEVPDSEDDENNISIIEITREVQEENLDDDADVSVLQVPLSPVQGILEYLPPDSEGSYEFLEIKSPEKTRKSNFGNYYSEHTFGG